MRFHADELLDGKEGKATENKTGTREKANHGTAC